MDVLFWHVISMFKTLTIKTLINNTSKQIQIHIYIYIYAFSKVLSNKNQQTLDSWSIIDVLARYLSRSISTLVFLSFFLRSSKLNLLKKKRNIEKNGLYELIHSLIELACGIGCFVVCLNAFHVCAFLS